MSEEHANYDKDPKRPPKKRGGGGAGPAGEHKPPKKESRDYSNNYDTKGSGKPQKDQYDANKGNYHSSQDDYNTRSDNYQNNKTRGGGVGSGQRGRRKGSEQGPNLRKRKNNNISKDTLLGVFLTVGAYNDIDTLIAEHKELFVKDKQIPVNEQVFSLDPNDGLIARTRGPQVQAHHKESGDHSYDSPNAPGSNSNLGNTIPTPTSTTSTSTAGTKTAQVGSPSTINAATNPISTTTATNATTNITTGTNVPASTSSNNSSQSLTDTNEPPKKMDAIQAMRDKMKKAQTNPATTTAQTQPQTQPKEEAKKPEEPNQTAKTNVPEAKDINMPTRDVEEPNFSAMDHEYENRVNNQSIEEPHYQDNDNEQPPEWGNVELDPTRRGDYQNNLSQEKSDIFGDGYNRKSSDNTSNDLHSQASTSGSRTNFPGANPNQYSQEEYYNRPGNLQKQTSNQNIDNPQNYPPYAGQQGGQAGPVKTPQGVQQMQTAQQQATIKYIEQQIQSHQQGKITLTPAQIQHLKEVYMSIMQGGQQDDSSYYNQAPPTQQQYKPTTTTSPGSYPKQQPTVQTQPSNRALPEFIFKYYSPYYDQKSWYYIDLQNQKQGPFSGKTMDEWYQNGYLPLTLNVTFGQNNGYKSLQELADLVLTSTSKPTSQTSIQEIQPKQVSSMPPQMQQQPQMTQGLQSQGQQQFGVHGDMYRNRPDLVQTQYGQKKTAEDYKRSVTGYQQYPGQQQYQAPSQLQGQQYSALGSQQYQQKFQASNDNFDGFGNSHLSPSSQAFYSGGGNTQFYQQQKGGAYYDDSYDNQGFTQAQPQAQPVTTKPTVTYSMGAGTGGQGMYQGGGGAGAGAGYGNRLMTMGSNSNIGGQQYSNQYGGQMGGQYGGNPR